MSRSSYFTPRQATRDAERLTSTATSSSSPAYQAQHVSKKVRLQTPTDHIPTFRRDEPVEDDEAVKLPQDDDSLNEVIMALDMRSRDTVGCCYYVARQETLYLTSDIKYGGIDCIDTCT